MATTGATSVAYELILSIDVFSLFIWLPLDLLKPFEDVISTDFFCSGLPKDFLLKFFWVTLGLSFEGLFILELTFEPPLFLFYISSWSSISTTAFWSLRSLFWSFFSIYSSKTFPNSSDWSISSFLASFSSGLLLKMSWSLNLLDYYELYIESSLITGLGIFSYIFFYVVAIA